MTRESVRKTFTDKIRKHCCSRTTYDTQIMKKIFLEIFDIEERYCNRTMSVSRLRVSVEFSAQTILYSDTALLNKRV